MKRYSLQQLTPREIDAIARRPASGAILPAVEEIVREVARNGDRAIQSFTGQFDGVPVRAPFEVTGAEFANAGSAVPDAFRQAIAAAARNIETFHRTQIPQTNSAETAPGVLCRREWRAIERVGLYVPGGSAPLVSTVLMLGIPALLAGCTNTILCTPPMKTGVIAPEILFAARTVGISRVYTIGGAQAIAAMAIGTTSVPRVQKIFGPGNRYVTEAKAVVSRPPYSVAIDMLAGPTELLIIADGTANPEWVAADLLSQAEHGADSQVGLVSLSDRLATEVEAAISRQILALPRQQVIERALGNSFMIVAERCEDAIAFANRYAPEHLILSVENAEARAAEITNAGSVFLGNFSSVVFGDYASGTNHTLPTGGSAAVTGGITVESFMKPVFFQTITAAGARHLGGTVGTLARAEGLDAHASAVQQRMRQP